MARHLGLARHVRPAEAPSQCAPHEHAAAAVARVAFPGQLCHLGGSLGILQQLHIAQNPAARRSGRTTVIRHSTAPPREGLVSQARGRVPAAGSGSGGSHVAYVLKDVIPGDHQLFKALRSPAVRDSGQVAAAGRCLRIVCCHQPHDFECVYALIKKLSGECWFCHQCATGDAFGTTRGPARHPEKGGGTDMVQDDTLSVIFPACTGTFATFGIFGHGTGDGMRSTLNTRPLRRSSPASRKYAAMQSAAIATALLCATRGNRITGGRYYS